MSDTITGLDWLDPYTTKNVSYDQILTQLGGGGLYAGWQYATEEQLARFFENTELKSTPYPTNAEWGEVYDFIDDWGGPTSIDTDGSYIYAMTLETPGD